MSVRIAYLVDQYPKISHSFIRREILALEGQGFEVLRIALRGWGDELVDAKDLAERGRTRYVLREGAAKLLWAVMRTMLRAPRRFLVALVLAIRMGRRADRSLPYHLAYFAEACLILRWLRSFGATHVHAHFCTNPTEVAMLARELGGPPFSFTVHGTEFFDNVKLIGIREKVHRAAFVVATSFFGRGQIYRWTDRFTWSKANVIHCGLEREFYSIAHRSVPSVLSVVCVGRLSPEKGQLLLLEAVHRLARKGLRLGLVLAGDGDDRPEIERLVAAYELTSQVRVTGWVSSERVREEILAARALIVPSLAEGLPVVIMEAMALGRPVLATFVGGIPELVRPAENGWLFPAGSVDAMVAALEECAATSVATLQAMGEAGHRRIVERYSVDKEAAKLAVLFKASFP